MSAVSNSVMPRSIALWITLREVSRSVRWPKLLQPRPTAETRRPEPPRLRICMEWSCGRDVTKGNAFWRAKEPVARCGPVGSAMARRGGRGSSHHRPKDEAQKEEAQKDAAP